MRLRTYIAGRLIKISANPTDLPPECKYFLGMFLPTAKNTSEKPLTFAFFPLPFPFF
jgi:hypothetical protein